MGLAIDAFGEPTAIVYTQGNDTVYIPIHSIYEITSGKNHLTISYGHDQQVRVEIQSYEETKDFIHRVLNIAVSGV